MVQPSGVKPDGGTDAVDRLDRPPRRPDLPALRVQIALVAQRVLDRVVPLVARGEPVLHRHCGLQHRWIGL